MKTISILIAKCGQEKTERLADYLESDYELHVTGIIDDGTKVIPELQKEQADILLMDLILHKKDGLEVLEDLLKTDIGYLPNCVIYTSIDKQEIITNAMNLGAKYYLMDTLNNEVLVKRLKEIGAGPSTIKTFQSDFKPKAMNKRELIIEIMHNLGISANLKGYHYILEAVNLSSENREMLNSFTKNLYPEIAKMNQTSAPSVEKAIRHSIETFWKDGGKQNFNTVFNYYDKKKKPTNSELIQLMVELIDRKTKNG